jgi:hypothetical protein
VVAFYEETEEAKLLRGSIRGTVLKEIEVCPDLISRQLREETGMQGKAARRDMALSDDDTTKNLI